ncbi:MAG: ABC transporter permease [Planctomycetes bacterium HGW-Planctomycetes-1]|nr:MAG: ABC transporter permease [Planctomycetes bacterium HGW-Planctomycetes-1]
MNNAPEKITVIIKGRSYWADSMGRLRRRKLAMGALAVIAAYLAIVLFIYAAQWTSLDIPILNWGQKIGAEYQPPSRNAIFGTDFLGRSVFRKTLYGARVSITVAFWASIISLAIGVPLGAAAGYFRGFIDDVIVWLYTTLSSIPYILLILAFALVLREKSLNLKWLGVGKVELSGIATVYLAIGLTSWVDICRLIRGEVMKHKERDYILAAQSYGCGSSRIIFRHLIPNVFHLIIISFSLRFVSFIQAEVILSFLGLGEKNNPSWGAMIDAARLDLPKGYWWEMTAATVAIFLISLALNVFGDALRDSLDPKLKVQ